MLDRGVDPFERATRGLSPAEMGAALGMELRLARIGLGWSRLDVVDHLTDDGIHKQTLACYEQGVRRMTVERWLQLCQVLTVSPVALLTRAIQRSTSGAIEVDLHSLCQDAPHVPHPVLKWARRRIKGNPLGDGRAHLTVPVVTELAIALGLRQADLTALLRRYVAEAHPAVLPESPAESIEDAVCS
ncbi:Helix-turn-helix domain-containing protein [Actinokineospora alba]|uniref:Helix-turn-helix domain-containing protein n=1 Tax=Actinokineospora alba TaxID=504798 RepID=A0A1H0LBT2_9PSEU|nr:helix-turn-helix transcriptional regulator [Actinokineospora alba]TDP67260.1 helix-turn-helix protein [Actinokineospora alba]SDJ02379.1 Helix-turn-helix domain-containing protein [Actinokineospora alba]SDO65410.1 Helix-turn-helix domain-containing protein [Actinokineospora alba]